MTPDTGSLPRRPRRLTVAILAALACLGTIAAAQAAAADDDREMGALDLDVSPEDAEVYVDGELLGVADDFDGFPTYLWLEKGTYDLVVFHPGYRTLARQVSIRPGEVIDVEDDMEPGEAVRPEDLASKSTVRRDDRLRRDRERAAAAAIYKRMRDAAQEVGRLHLDARPADAVVYLDGAFLGTAEELGYLSEGLVVEPGQHVVEVLRPGYRGARRSLVVPLGEHVDLEIELDPE